MTANDAPKPGMTQGRQKIDRYLAMAEGKERLFVPYLNARNLSDVIHIVSELNENLPQVKELTLDCGEGFRGSTTAELARLKNVTTLSIVNCGLGLKELGFLRDMPNLEKLNISHNHIGPGHIPQLLETFPKLKSLCLFGKELHDTDYEALAKAEQNGLQVMLDSRSNEPMETARKHLSLGNTELGYSIVPTHLADEHGDFTHVEAALPLQDVGSRAVASPADKPAHLTDTTPDTDLPGHGEFTVSTHKEPKASAK